MNLESVHFPTTDEKTYEQRLPILQQQLMAYQQMIYLKGERLVIGVEGTDASGKGGMVKTLIESMDPRGYRVHSIGAPYGHELDEHYLQRFWRRIPRKGNIAIFDRTWYGRVLIEKIELALPEKKWRAAYDEIEAFEKQLTHEGFLLIKLFLHISKEEQKKRFLRRLDNPEKSWKLTTADLHTRLYWEEYQEEYQRMLDRGEKAGLPWHVVPANEKYHARLRSLEVIIEVCRKYYGEPVLPEPDPTIRKMAEQLA
jgi:polyphosphate kinase 2 (PPK2 family)